MTLQSEKPVIEFKCSVCGADETRHSDGFIVCTKCGTCQDRDIVQGTFSSKESYSGPSQYVEFGNKIHVATAKGSHIGHPSERLSMFKTSKIIRLKRINRQALMGVEERLLQGLKKINKVAVQLQLPQQTRDRASYLHRKMLPHFTIYKSQYPLVVCVLVLAIREHKLPFREIEVLEVISLKSKNKNQVNHAKFFIMDHLGISWPRSQPEWFIPKIISIIRKNPHVLARLEKRNGTQDYFNRLERLAIKIVKPMTTFDYGSRFPNILAASLIYTIDSHLLRVLTQKTISEAAGVAEFAIRTHYGTLWKKKKKEILEEVSTE